MIMIMKHDSFGSNDNDNDEAKDHNDSFLNKIQIIMMMLEIIIRPLIKISMMLEVNEI